MNFKDKIKSNWKTVVIVLLAIMFVSKCSSSGNYERKYKKEVKEKEYVIDSMTNVYSNSAKYIDSLKHVIEVDETKISLLNEQLKTYKEQNAELNDRNKSLANKQIIVNVEKEKN